jgi:DNA-binding CsgD family transcriptional regulator
MGTFGKGERAALLQIGYAVAMANEGHIESKALTDLEALAGSADATGESSIAYSAHLALSHILGQKCAHEPAARHAMEALGLLEDPSSIDNEALALNYAATNTIRTGSASSSHQLVKRLSGLLAQCSDRRVITEGLKVAAEHALRRGDFPATEKSAREGLKLGLGHGSFLAIQGCLAAFSGNFTRAAKLLAVSLKQATSDEMCTQLFLVPHMGLWARLAVVVDDSNALDDLRRIAVRALNQEGFSPASRLQAAEALALISARLEDRTNARLARGYIIEHTSDGRRNTSTLIALSAAISAPEQALAYAEEALKISRQHLFRLDEAFAGLDRIHAQIALNLPPSIVRRSLEQILRLAGQFNLVPVSEACSRILAEIAHDRPAFSAIELSAREMQVVALMQQGKTNDQIAETLYISRHTAKHHVSHILAKTGAKNRTEAVRMVLEGASERSTHAGPDAASDTREP